MLTCPFAGHSLGLHHLFGLGLLSSPGCLFGPGLAKLSNPDFLMEREGMGTNL